MPAAPEHDTHRLTTMETIWTRFEPQALLSMFQQEL